MKTEAHRGGLVPKVSLGDRRGESLCLRLRFGNSSEACVRWGTSRAGEPGAGRMQMTLERPWIGQRGRGRGEPGGGPGARRRAAVERQVHACPLDRPPRAVVVCARHASALRLAGSRLPVALLW